jgi:PQQ-like domain
LSNLVGVGGRIVYLGVDDQGNPLLVGLDASKGAVVWSRPSTLGQHISGVEELLVTAGDTVFDVEPTGSSNTRVAYPAQATSGADVVAVDGHDGKEIWRHSFTDIRTPLDKCGDNVCVGVDAAGGHFDITQLNAATGDVVSEGAAAFEPIAAEDGEFDISASRDDDAIELTSGFGKTVVWTHTREELFGSSAVSPDNGWSGYHVNGVWVVWLGGAVPSLGATSGIADDGHLLWTKAETSPCFTFTDDPITVSVACGRVDAAAQVIYLGTVTGLDPATGATTWTLDLGNVNAFDTGSSIVRIAGACTTPYTARAATLRSMRRRDRPGRRPPRTAGAPPTATMSRSRGSDRSSLGRSRRARSTKDQTRRHRRPCRTSPVRP